MERSERERWTSSFPKRRGFDRMTWGMVGPHGEEEEEDEEDDVWGLERGKRKSAWRRRKPPRARTTDRSCCSPHPVLAHCFVQISSQSLSSCAVLCHCLFTHPAIASVRASTCFNTSNSRLSSKRPNPSTRSTTSSSSSSTALAFFILVSSWREVAEGSGRFIGVKGKEGLRFVCGGDRKLGAWWRKRKGVLERENK